MVNVSSAFLNQGFQVVLHRMPLTGWQLLRYERVLLTLEERGLDHLEK